MATREDLRLWLIECLKAHGGKATIVEVCKCLWENHREDFVAAGDLFYTWQYDVRWAATQLRQAGKIRDAASSPKGVWELTA